MVRYSEMQQFPDFLKLFLGNFRTICLRFENVEIFGRMVSSLYFVLFSKTLAVVSFIDIVS